MMTATFPVRPVRVQERVISRLLSIENNIRLIICQIRCHETCIEARAEYTRVQTAAGVVGIAYLVTWNNRGVYREWLL